MKPKNNQLKLVGNCATCGNPIYGNLDLEENKDPIVKRTCNCHNSNFAPNPVPFQPPNFPVYPWYQEPYKITYNENYTPNTFPQGVGHISYVNCMN